MLGRDPLRADRGGAWAGPAQRGALGAQCGGRSGGGGASAAHALCIVLTENAVGFESRGGGGGAERVPPADREADPLQVSAQAPARAAWMLARRRGAGSGPRAPGRAWVSPPRCARHPRPRRLAGGTGLRGCGSPHASAGARGERRLPGPGVVPGRGGGARLRSGSTRRWLGIEE